MRNNGYEAWLVGGCVRDLLLGISPKDYDVCTSATPDQVLAIWPDSQRVGAHFGVVLVHCESVHVEVATYRSDGAYADGRRPLEVRFETDARLDVLRRDFTINALLLDPFTGEVRDYVNGQADLRAQLIRAIGEPEARFREDHLRMLRAVRFASRLHFEIEEETERSISRLHLLAADVSPERVRDEVVRILTQGSARKGFELLSRTGLLQTVLPEVEAMHGVEQPAEYHPEGDVWTHTMIMLDMLPAGASPALAMGVLLHDVGKPGTFRVADRIRFDGHVELGVEIAHRILTRLRFSSEDIRQIEALVGNHMKFKDVPKMKESTLKRFLRLHDFDEHLELHRLDCASSRGLFDNYEFVKQRRDEFGAEEIRPPRLVNGRDLMAAGFSPGPELGKVLDALEDAQLEGRIATREEGLALAGELKP
ncbi:MAG: CCA tRNA nucleotidyltransferase [Bryobacteraceae bacterium]|nr:CCA tRNA nucleotidyltransferase [Bryobacteraceae bacterium]